VVVQLDIHKLIQLVNHQIVKNPRAIAMFSGAKIRCHHVPFTWRKRKPQDLEWQTCPGVLLFGASGLLRAGLRGCSAIDPNDQRRGADEYLVQQCFLPDLLCGVSILQ